MYSRHTSPLVACTALFLTLTACGPDATGTAVDDRAFSASRNRADLSPRYSEWSAPVHLGPLVNSPFVDIEVTISRDGLSLYVASNRPGGFGSFDIWVSRRASVDAPWAAAQPLGSAINTEFREQGPFLSLDGHRLFFFSDRPGGLGELDLWVSRRRDTRDDFGWEAPVNLGSGVNSAGSESQPVFFEDEGGGAVLYFTANRGGNDIFVSTLQGDESFGPAVPVAELNSPRRDRVQAIRRDGLELFIGSDRPGPVPEPFDLWVATRASTRDPWSTPVKLGPVINSAAGEPSAALSFDGTTLYVVSDRPGGSGNLDVWTSTRRKLRGGDDGGSE